MRVLRVREGFATNSSSMHSIILSGTFKGSAADASAFGWDWFVQESYQEKILYFAQMLATNLNGTLGEVGAEEAAAAVFGLAPGTLKGGYVDHQSVLGIPQDKYGKPHIEFWRLIGEAVAKDPTVAIRGGNDNEEAPAGNEGDVHPRYDFLNSLSSRNFTITERDGWWTLFNKKDGQKWHLSLGDTDAKTYSPSSPELVDLKITDYCNIGCSFCYQGSTEEGKHAPMADLQEYATSMKEAGVLEVAIGGGEPTTHPDFIRIIEMFSKADVVPNFTTKSVEWYKNPEMVAAAVRNCGNWAHSVTTARELRAVIEAREACSARFGVSLPPLTIQYILDGFPLENFMKIVEGLKREYRANITLLGYKEVGRGGKRPYNNVGWLKAFIDSKSEVNLGIDTVIANQYEDELKAAEISEKRFYKEEGRFSMYIDAVTKSYAKSSFENSMKPLVIDTTKRYGSKIDLPKIFKEL